MYGLSLYIMRADYFPPRKNVISRAKDKVQEWFKDLGEKPIGVPTPAYAYHRTNLEEQLV